MKKFAVASLLILVGVFACAGIVYASHQDLIPSSQEESELFPCELIEDVNEEENLYVSLNNSLVQAMSDYENGKINLDEYKQLCEEIQAEIEKNGERNVEKAEKEYLEGVKE